MPQLKLQPISIQTSQQGLAPAFRLMFATSWLAPPNWRQNQESAIREAVAANLDWAEYIRLVDRHRTPALSCAALKRIPDLKIPPSAVQQLQKRSDACRMQAIRNSLLLAEVLKLFARAAIPAMPLKGPILSHDLYADVGLRHSKDLDIACTVDDLARAQTCLEEAGWEHDSLWTPPTPRLWQSMLRHDQELAFTHPQTRVHLEIHWRDQWGALNLAQDRWTRSSPSLWQQSPYQAMHPVDRTLYLCGHGADHAWTRAKWLGDLARIHAEGSVDWQAVLLEARRLHQERALLACLLLLQQLYALPLPNLAGDPWQALPTFLLAQPLQILQSCEEPDVSGASTTLPNFLRHHRYNRLLHPHKPLRRSLAEMLYSRPDHHRLPLPDSLFWAYAPLRPILWFWRRVLRRSTSASPHPADKPSRS
jgi:hypothetical protein